MLSPNHTQNKKEDEKLDHKLKAITEERFIA